MRILCIDYGEKHIGLAVSDPLLATAQPLDYYRSINKKEDLNYFRKLIDTYAINKIVIGLPLEMDGKEGTQSEKTKRFALRLEKELKLPIIFWDERLSTKQALHILFEQKADIQQKRKNKDKISAAIILSSYLESLRK
ncbi:MAG: Holliday junction resolvase RuvX [Candidatus Aminicenantes bacterium]|nr:Holliday junction resolvase RuvX [Candidatus Aminicenantes bacterium]